MPNCQANYDGSANSMEVAAGCVLFHRSQNLKLQYGNVVCDGDSKTSLALNTEKVYGDTPIIKEDCINHVAKRMWMAIDTLKKKLQGICVAQRCKHKMPMNASMHRSGGDVPRQNQHL